MSFKETIKIYGVTGYMMHVFNCAVRWTYWKYFKVTHLAMYKNPEAIIPENTDYCYKWLSPPLPNQNVKYCPFHRSTTIFPKYAGTEDLCMLYGDDCINDSCKTCGINCPDDFLED